MHRRRPVNRHEHSRTSPTSQRKHLCFVLLDAHDYTPDLYEVPLSQPYEALSSHYPDEAPSSSTLFVDQAHQEAQSAVKEGNAVLDDVSDRSATQDAMMGDETAHRKREADKDLVR
jgi:hypothetical protein